ncbi:MAG TPA: DNA primase [Streptomyces sp.]
MNRTALGLAIGAGYLLGRTRKLKLALAVGSVVAGKRLNLTPGALTELVSRQLRDNPQFKEIGDQLREDVRGVGKAATGAVVERRLDSLAGRLHGRTEKVRGQLEGVLPEMDGREAEADDGARGQDGDDNRPRPKKKAPAKKAPAKKMASAAQAAKKPAPSARPAKRGEGR